MTDTVTPPAIDETAPDTAPGNGPAEPDAPVLGSGRKLVRHPRAPWAAIVRSSAFVRKELVEILRQPRLLALLVLGPFGLLVLFGAGYSTSDFMLRAMFVGPPGSVFEEVLDRYEADLDQLVDAKGYVNDETTALTALRDGDVDVVVIFPGDPVATVLDGTQAEIRVVHDEIDPLRQTAIDVATRLAVQEVNAAVLSSVASEVQATVAPAAGLVAELDALAGRFDAASADPAELEAAADETRTTLVDLATLLDGSIVVLGRLDAAQDSREQLETARATVSDLRDRAAGLDTASPDDVAAFVTDLRLLAAEASEIALLNPDLLVRPFNGITGTLAPRAVTPSDYFTPSSLALLLQHLGVTFAALSLVRDRSTGLIEVLRIGPLSPTEIIIGKATAFLALGAVVATALVAATTLVLDVPMLGSLGWMAAMVAGVILASLALGMVLSMLSSTESQAVQYSMLTLLAGLFFSGFVLSTDDLVFPVSLVPWVLPVTYGISSFQDIMLRGITPANSDVIGLAALVVVYGTFAIASLRRTLRIA